MKHFHLGMCPVSASGVPFNASYIQSKGDPIVDLTENLAAEQKARATYECLINMADDPDVLEPLKFLRARKIVITKDLVNLLELFKITYKNLIYIQ